MFKLRRIFEKNSDTFNALISGTFHIYYSSESKERGSNIIFPVTVTDEPFPWLGQLKINKYLYFVVLVAHSPDDLKASRPMSSLT